MVVVRFQKQWLVSAENSKPSESTQKKTKAVCNSASPRQPMWTFWNTGFIYLEDRCAWVCVHTHITYFTKISVYVCLYTHACSITCLHTRLYFWVFWAVLNTAEYTALKVAMVRRGSFTCVPGKQACAATWTFDIVGIPLVGPLSQNYALTVLACTQPSLDVWGTRIPLDTKMHTCSTVLHKTA